MSSISVFQFSGEARDPCAAYIPYSYDLLHLGGHGHKHHITRLATVEIRSLVYAVGSLNRGNRDISCSEIWKSGRCASKVDERRQDSVSRRDAVEKDPAH